MKKIGILTYHRSDNYGAIMQAYSLAKKISDDYPEYRVEIIDYTSKKVFYYYNQSMIGWLYLIIKTKGINNKKPYIRMSFEYLKRKILEPKKIEILKRRHAYFEECLKVLPLSNNKLISDDIKKFNSYVSAMQYSAIIVGSDAVFNWVIRGFPSPYFLHDITCTKMSYAASANGQRIDNLSEYETRYLSEALNDFSYLGVRDAITEKFIYDVDCSLECHHNCDPTVFLDLKELPVDITDIKNKLEENGIDFSKPIIGIMLTESIAEIIKKYISTKYQIISVFDFCGYADVQLSELTPFEWAKVFSLFTFTITDRFHGTLLSIKNGTPVIAIQEKKCNGQPNLLQKQFDLMKRFDLLDFCFYLDDIQKDDSKFTKCIQGIIDDDYKFGNVLQVGIERESLNYYQFKAKLDEILSEEH